MKGDGQSGSRESARDRADAGRGLAAAAGFQVVTAAGAVVGRLDHIRYGRRTDMPDELTIRPSRLFFWRREVIQFDRVDRVEPRTRTVVLRAG